MHSKIYFSGSESPTAGLSDMFFPTHEIHHAPCIRDVHGPQTSLRGALSAELSVHVRASREQSRARLQALAVPRISGISHDIGGAKTRAECGNAAGCMQEEVRNEGSDPHTAFSQGICVINRFQSRKTYFSPRWSSATKTRRSSDNSTALRQRQASSGRLDRVIQPAAGVPPEGFTRSCDSNTHQSLYQHALTERILHRETTDVGCEGW
ncbi:hypothetical protein V8E53_004137 [Lactarius tabidus]